MRSVVGGLFFLLLVPIPSPSRAQGVVRGTVLGIDDIPLAGARVHVAGSSLVAITAAPAGSFRLSGVAAGVQRLLIEHGAYLLKMVEVSVPEGGEARVTVRFDQTSLHRLAELVVTGTGFSARPEAVPQVVTQIAAEEVRSGHFYNPGSALDVVPGIRVITYGSTIGGSQGVSIRSLNGGPPSNKTLVLVDGRPVNGAWNGGLNWNTIPMEVVDRIEVVKGPASSLYGSQASAGVIQIFTRSAPPGVHGDVSVAEELNAAPHVSDAQARGFGRAEVGGENVQLTGSYGGERTSHLLALSGYRSRENFVSIARNRWSDLSLNYKLEHRLSDELTGRLFVDAHGDRWEKPADRVPNATENRDLAVDAVLVRQTAHGGVNVRAYLNRNHQRYEGLESALRTGNLNRRYGLIVDGAVELVGGLATVGVDASLDDADVDYARTVVGMQPLGIATVGVLDRRSGEVSPQQVELFSGSYGGTREHYRVSNVAAFAQFSRALGARVNALAGARVDHHSVFGTVLNPKVGATFTMLSLGRREAPYTTTLKANYAHGFRAPAMWDLYSKDVGGYGDPALHPERTRSLDLGLLQRFAAWGSLELTYFRMWVEELIINDNVGSTGWGYYVAVPSPQGGTDTVAFNLRRNLGDYRPSGAEVALHLQPHERMSLNASYSYLEPQQFTFQTSRNRYLGSLRVWQPLGAYRVDAEVLHRLTGAGYLGDFRTAPFGRFSLTDLGVGFEGWRRSRVSLLVRNLADTRYQLLRNVWMPGRTLLVQLRTRF